MKKENKNLILIDDVNVWDKNPREISSKDFESLKKKIERWGIWKPFLVWESKKQILGGNSRFKACKELGHKEIWVEYREPKDDAEALEMAIADNESSGEWIKSLLIEQIKLNEDKINLEDYKINIKDTTLKDLMPIDAEEDNPPDEADVKSVSVFGDLYELGNHRVLCGDSTSVDNVEKLMNGKKADMVFTDPPYNYAQITGAGIFKKAVVKLGKDISEISEFNPSEFLDTLLLYFEKDSINAFIFCNKDLIHRYLNYAVENKYSYNVLTWHKKSFIPLSGSHHFPDTEYLIYIRKNSIFNSGLSTEHYRKYFIIDNEKSEDHPTIKPIIIIKTEVEVASNKGGIIVDTFLGSGSTLIACEKTERICYGMELDTHYTDVIVARYIKYMQDNNKPFTIKRNGEEIDYNLFLKDGK